MFNQKILRILNQLLIRDLTLIKNSSNIRIAETFSDSIFYPRSLSVTSKDEELTIQVCDQEPFLKNLLNEANKFYLGSRLSFRRSLHGHDKNLSWQVIEYYYSAYYAIHYLSRMTGMGLVNIDESVARKIETNSLGSIKKDSISAGLYLMKFDNASNYIKLSRKVDRKKGGSHLDAWRMWSLVLDRMIENMNLDLSEYAKEQMDLIEHRKYIKDLRPPAIRGEINYQFKGGLWIFEDKKSSFKATISRALNDDTMLFNTSDPLLKFIYNNKNIIFIANSLFDSIVKRNPTSICGGIKNKYRDYIL